MVVKTESLEQARQVTELLPAVKAGMLKADALSWYAARKPQGLFATSTDAAKGSRPAVRKSCGAKCGPE